MDGRVGMCSRQDGVGITTALIGARGHGTNDHQALRNVNHGEIYGLVGFGM